MKVVIVGGVAGGATAAARIRRLDEKAEIIVFERSGYVSYANCGLPYYIGGVIEAPQELTIQTPESFFERFRVDMRVRHEVTAIHPERKAVSVRNLTTGEEFEESYDKLLLSPGAKPTQPRLPGMGIKQLFTLRTVEDTFRIKTYIQEHQPKSAVLAGGGFIGLELAENLRKLGMEVTIVQRPKQLMNPFDADMAALLHNEVRRHGVKLALGHSVEGFEEKNGGVDVLLADAAPLHADMVVLAIGVTPDSHLAKEAGLELGVRGSILVSDRMETSVPDIYAVGDAVQVKHFVTGEDTLIALAGPANKQGRIAADNICGGDSRYAGSQGSSVIQVFDLTAAVTGINETTAKRLGIQADTVVLSPMSHAGYYPGGKLMTMKVVFEPKTGRLLGAQIVGYDGVDKRIDVLATAIRAGMKTAEERMKKLQKLIEYGKNYTEYKPIHDELKKLKNGWTSKRDKYEEAHRAELTLWNAASRYLHANLPKGTKSLPISEWEKEYATLSGQRTAEYTKLKETRAEVAELHNIRKCVDIALKADQPEQTRAKRHDLER